MHAPLAVAGILAATTAVSAGTTLSDVVMWDYRETAPSHTPLSDYHAWLLTWIAANPPPRLVLYVTSPCIGPPYSTFYDPTASPTTDAKPANFVDFLADLHQANPTVEIEVLVDRSSFPASGASTPCWGQPASTHPHLFLPSEWDALPLIMDWFGELLSNTAISAGPIAGITFDPEVSATNIPGNSCEVGACCIGQSCTLTTYAGCSGDWYGEGTDCTGTTCNSPPIPDPHHAVAISYQQVIDWVDAWKYSNGCEDKRTGMAFEVDSTNMTRVNVSGFPLSSSLQSVLAATSPELHCQLTTGGFPEWRPSTPQSLLQSAYLEVYVDCARQTHPPQILQASSFWRWQSEHGCDDSQTPVARTPAEAATSLQLTMTQQAGSPGPGTLEVSTSGQVVTFGGIGTRFLDWADYTRVTAIGTSGSPVPPTGQWTFTSAASNTAATGHGSAAETSGQHLDYLYTELVMNWMYPYVNSGMASRIYPMFSARAEKVQPFFGVWTDTEFLAFLDAFAAATDGSDLAHAIYTNNGTTPVASPANWAMYDLRLVCDNWGLHDYPGSASYAAACAADLDGDGLVGILDLLQLLEDWGTTDASDLQSLISVWQMPC